MSAEIICVGTELLLGNIVNGNAQYIAQELAKLGIPHYYQTVVGDNPHRLKRAIAIACDRARVLIFTGGLGPTPDDLTAETLADFFEAPLVEHPEIIEDIARKYARRGRQMTPANRKQALIPQGADILPNPIGSAPGIIWQPRENVTILTFPGVPSEMQRMWQDTAAPYLQSQGWGREIFYTRMLKFWGITESKLVEKIASFLELPNPTVAPYANLGEVQLRIAARADSEPAARSAIEPVERQIREIAGLDCFGADDDTLASVAGKLLLEAGETLSVAESCTGGGLGQMLTAISGSSSYFWGGVISYDNRVKVSLLGVSADDLDRQGAVSHAVAKHMAGGVRDRLGTDWGVSITGIAGPGGGSEEKPVGLVYIGVARPDATVESYEYRLGERRDRAWIRYGSSCNALDRLRRQLLRRQEKIRG